MLSHILSILLVLLVGFLSYSNSFQGQFVFDDITGIVQKKAIHDLDNIPAIWEANHSRFLANLSFAINYHLGGLKVEGYHAVNIGIHLLNGVLVYWFVLLLGKAFSLPATIPLFVALLFVSHPIQTQAVAYISQRTTSMAALWYLLSAVLWVSFVRAHRSVSRRRYGVLVLSYLFAVCAFLTKEYTYTLPLTAGLLLFFIPKKRLPRSSRIAAGVFFIIAAVTFLSVRTTVLNTPAAGVQEAVSLPSYSTNDNSREEFFLSQAPVVVTYMRLLLVPVNQNIDHDVAVYHSLTDPVIIGSLVVLAIVVGVALWLRTKNPFISFGLLFFFITLASESSVIPITDLMMEHRLYLPSVGFFLAAGEGIRWFFRRFSIRPALYTLFLIVLIVGSMALTYRRNIVWGNGLELWNDAVSKSPEKARSHFNFGGALISHGYRAEGIDELIIAQHLDPSYREAMIAIFALLQKGQQP